MRISDWSSDVCSSDLSWADVLAALRGDAVNVVVHEFAHQLDDANPHSEGAPPLADYTQWSTVMQHEYERLRRHRRPPVFETYGGQSPGEFFGVVSEAFIQRPVETRRHQARKSVVSGQSVPVRVDLGGRS